MRNLGGGGSKTCETGAILESMNSESSAILVLTETFPFDGNSESFFIDELRVLGANKDLIFLPQVIRGKRYSGFEQEVIGPGRWRLSKELLGALAIISNSVKLDLRHLRQDTFSSRPKRYFSLFIETLQVLLRLGRIDWRRLEGTKVTAIYSLWGRTEGTCAAALSSLLGVIRTLIRHHNQDLYEERTASGFIPGLRFYSQNEAYTKVFLCDAARKRAITSFSAKNTRAIPLAVDLGQTLTQPSTGDLRFITISYESEVKRHSLLFDTFRILSLAGKEFKWVHIGHSPTLRTLAESSSNKFLDYRGSRDNSYVREELATGPYHFLISVSTFEGLPFTMLEAISAGVPSIGTQVGCVESLLGEQAVLTTDAGGPEWAKFIQEALHNRDEILQSQQTKLDQYSAQDLIPRLLRVMAI